MLDLLRDVLARLIAIEEAIEDGDSSLAWDIAEDLELDLREQVAAR